MDNVLGSERCLRLPLYETVRKLRSSWGAIGAHLTMALSLPLCGLVLAVETCSLAHKGSGKKNISEPR